MSAGKYTIDVEQGATFLRTLTWKDSDGVVIDLTGYTAKMQVRKGIGTDVVLELTTPTGISIPTPANGQIIINIDATTTAGLDANSYKYDLEMISGSFVTRLIEGAFNVDAEITV